MECTRLIASGAHCRCTQRINHGACRRSLVIASRGGRPRRRGMRTSRRSTLSLSRIDRRVHCQHTLPSLVRVRPQIQDRMSHATESSIQDIRSGAFSGAALSPRHLPISGDDQHVENAEPPADEVSPLGGADVSQDPAWPSLGSGAHADPMARPRSGLHEQGAPDERYAGDRWDRALRPSARPSSQASAPTGGGSGDSSQRLQ